MRSGIWIVLSCVGALSLAALMSGCAGREFAPKQQVWYYHRELPAADRAVEAARAAGKDKACPAEFQAAEKAKNDAYEIYWSCRTMEGIAKANEAAAQANALCPKRGAERAPASPPSRRPLPPPIDRLTLHINFDTDKSEIRKADIPELEKAVAFVKKYPKSRVSVEGYTDNQGSDEYNLGLSDRRAREVKKYLVGKGEKADRITAVGKGNANPVGDNKTEKGRFENRRVEVLILGE